MFGCRSLCVFAGLSRFILLEKCRVMRTLVVDDSKVVRRLLVGVLERHCDCHDITQAENGTEAFDYLISEDFDLVLLDWEMPGMNGLSVLRRIRARGNKTPVIMVTSEAGKERIVEAYDAGANNYIVKPFEPRALADKILKMFDGFLDTSKRSGPPCSLVVDDSPVMRRILAGVLKKQCGFGEVVEAGDGVEAVESVKRHDFDLILLDWNMPNMLGIDALKQIRWLGSKTPVIMVTSEVERSSILAALEAGANDYLIKPFTADTVEKRVKKILYRHS